MADIDVKCSKCGKIVSVSEFADISSLKCSFCDMPFVKPETAAQTFGAKLKVAEKSNQEGKSSDPPPEQWAYYKYMKTRDGGAGKRQLNLGHILSWIVFLLLGAATGFLRYGKVLPPQYLEYARAYSPGVVGVLYLAIIILGFKDSILQGVLCLMVPLYPLYYLLICCDVFIFRAIVAGILVGTGEDSFLYYREIILGWVKWADEWISKASVE